MVGESFSTLVLTFARSIVKSPGLGVPGVLGVHGVQGGWSTVAPLDEGDGGDAGLVGDRSVLMTAAVGCDDVGLGGEILIVSW